MICFLICEYFHQKYWPGKVVLEFDEWIKWSGEKHLQLRLQNNFWSPHRLCTMCFNCNPIFQCRSNRILNPLNKTTHMSQPKISFMDKVVQKTFSFRPINVEGMWGWMVAKSFNSSIWNYLCEYNFEHVCGKAFKFLVWQVQWGIKVEWSTKNKCIVHNFIVREHESGKVNITFWKIGYLYILLVENILVFHILFSDIICFVNSRIWWYEYCVFFIWILCILHIIFTNILCVVFHIFCISIIYIAWSVQRNAAWNICVIFYCIYKYILIFSYSHILYCIFWHSDNLYCIFWSSVLQRSVILCSHFLSVERRPTSKNTFSLPLQILL